ncbi:hypothetical protein CALVIDRAFT_541760 [Calocera viscosa TUFC12733]|uniref:ChrR-like cupin domain-containing protein n=1 Tax=Calocera viscosa (strain TUFC12733) TaxID=1330018 RepID=A0A167HGK7_CALVF|nr:hypothetical protein CALVIDRAFT_541760 [Calocera viscosa TUFC12733]
MPKPQTEFQHSASVPAVYISPGDPASTGYTTIRVLSRDPETGDQTAILHHPPGAEWGEAEGVTHVYYEECVILKGRIYDKALGKWFGPGHFCCRNPRMVHGPYKSDEKEGCEEIAYIRYPAKE